MLCGAAQSLSQIVVFRILQGAFGAGLVPISQMLFTRGHQTNQALLAEQVTPFRAALQHPWLPGLWDWSTPSGLALLGAEAAMSAYLNDFMMVLWATILLAPMVIFLRMPPPSQPAG